MPLLKSRAYKAMPGLGSRGPGGWPAAVEAWRSDLNDAGAADVGGVEFLLAWIDRESAGNPCSYTSLRESGIFQLMPPDNTTRGGTTEAALRTACVGSTQQQSHELSDDERAEQVNSGLQYIRYLMTVADSKLAAVGVDWPKTDSSYWKFVKLQHAYPGPSAGWLSTAKQTLGRDPTWDEMVQYGGNVRQDVVDNANAVGAYGGGGSSSGWWVFLAGVAVVGAGWWWMHSKRSIKIPHMPFAGLRSRSLGGYRVAYGTSDARGTFRAFDEHTFQTIEAATKRMRAYKRQGLWTWVEDEQGNLVPVPGAKTERVRKGYPLRDLGAHPSTYGAKQAKLYSARYGLSPDDAMRLTTDRRREEIIADVDNWRAARGLRPDDAKVRGLIRSQLGASDDRIPGLTKAVHKALHQIGPAGRDSQDKVFISALWNKISPDFPQLRLPGFKRWLIEANREGKISLSRADLSPAMDQRLVRASEIEDHGAAFHFVLDPDVFKREGHVG